MIIIQKEEFRTVYRFVGISRIQNNFKRRVALALLFLPLLCFNCIAPIPPFLMLRVYSILELLSVTLKRWRAPMGDEELREVINDH